MEFINLQTIGFRTNKEFTLANNCVYINTSPDFQRNYEAWDDKLRTRFIESIILNRAMNPIWIVLNEEDDSEEILDGMHRITTALSFYKNEFCINKTYLLSLDGEKYNKKYFNDLDIDDKSRVRNYNFIFNKLDSSYRKDSNKLRDMYEILNRSSKTLNDYEFNRVILRPFYDIISKHKDNFIKSNFFNRIRDLRGNIDTEIIEMFVLSNKLINGWSSIHKLTDEWIKNNIGETSEKVSEFIKNHGEELENKLIFMPKIITNFYQLNLFSLETKIFKKFFLPYKIIIVRCCYLIKTISLFNRLSVNIINKLKTEVLTDKMEQELGCSNRNAVFQKKLMDKIDEIINYELEREGNTRRFSKLMIKTKLSEQKNLCPICSSQIKDDDNYEGDHIIPWTAGGKTVLDNLQVLHKRCHQIKSAF
jgi:hypothetical protein